MDSVVVACFDVYYYDDYANASCIVFRRGKQDHIISEYSEIINGVNEYIPGQFYKRELPCILHLLDKVLESIDFIIVDSFVWLNDGRKGLGGYLYDTLGGRIPVVGVAKTFYKDSTNYKEVYRGKSNKPLFVSAIGLDEDYAAKFVKELDGEYRIPEMLKQVDQLSRKQL